MSIPLITLPKGENPWPSRKVLSPKLMNNCVVRVFGPAVAKVMVPRALLPFTRSSGMFAARHFAETAGSPWMPNWTMKPGTTRKNPMSLK